MIICFEITNAQKFHVSVSGIIESDEFLLSFYRISMYYMVCSIALELSLRVKWNHYIVHVL